MDKNELTRLDVLRSDLVFQLKTPDDLDWDYFVETAKMAREQANKEGRNMTPDKKI